VMSRVALPEETQLERQLRPQRLDEYVGQRTAVESLRVSVEAARQRSEPLDHVLLSGPPGLGKTTLATILANEMGAAIVTTAGPSLERGGDLMGILTNLNERDILFVDEIHRLPRVVEELLYPAMEDFTVNFIMDKGLNARTMRIPLRPFTMVGATTRPGMLSSPLRERFGIFHHLDFYSLDELQAIVARSASILGTNVQPDGAQAIARRSRGTPRIANRLLRRVRDYVQVKGDGVVTAAAAVGALTLEGVDSEGLDRLDTRFLRAIIEQYGGGPVGLEAIAATINDEAETLAEVVEPFLLKIGFLIRTPTGRKAIQLTEEGRTYVTEHPDEMAAVWAPFAEQVDDDEAVNFKQVIGQTVGAIVQVATTGTPDQREKAIEILGETRRRLYGLLAEGPDAAEDIDDQDSEEE